MGASFIEARVFRFDPQVDVEPRFETYRVLVQAPVSAMVLVRMVHEEDPSLACRTSMCFHGMCNSCLMRVNGKNVRGCTYLVQPGESVTIEPHSGYRLVRDLVVDFSRRPAPE